MSQAVIGQQGIYTLALPRRASSKETGKHSFLAEAAHGIPTLLTFAALAALGYWGHHTGWTIPKFSALAGAVHAKADDWCAAHNVPESQCIACKPDLLPQAKETEWCGQHGISDCVQCNLDLAQVNGEPQLPKADIRAALAAGVRPESDPRCETHRRRLQFASLEYFAKSGVEVEAVEEREIVETVSGNGEIGYDPTRVVRISTPVAGRVWRVEKRVGDAVRQGEVVALVDAAELGRAKAELLQALAAADVKDKVVKRVQPLAEKQIKTAADLLEAQAQLREARVRLYNAQQNLINLGLPVDIEELKDLAEHEAAERVRLLGLSDAVRQTLDPRTTTANLLPLRAPFDGVVVSREVVAGEVIELASTLLTVADTSRMWVTIAVRPEDAVSLTAGQPIIFRPDTGPREPICGTISWISTAVDETTRTVKVRAELENPAGRLRANTFGMGQIVLREEQHAVAVPTEAVHWEGCCHVVFVQDKNFAKPGVPKVFHVRKVRPGTKDERNIEIIAGLLPGELVATRGSGVLRAELLRNNLGAG